MKKYVGAILETTEGKFLFHHRDNKSWIVNPNMIGLFGGLIEDGESAEQALIRELQEELELVVRPIQLILLKNLSKLENEQFNPTHSSERTLYVIKNIDHNELRLNPNEGQGIIIFDPLTDQVTNQYTPLTIFALSVYKNYGDKKI